MRRAALFIAAALCCARAFAATPQPQTVELLISLDPSLYPTGVAGALHDYSHYPQKLEDEFRQAFEGKGYTVIVKNNADRTDLHEALHSPANVGVYWVSHEAPIAWSGSTGLEITPQLVDYRRADVKDELLESHPNLRWLSIAGCQSQLLADWISREQTARGIAANPNLQIFGFEDEVDAVDGLKQSIKKSRDALDYPRVEDGYSMSCPSLAGQKLSLERELTPGSSSNGALAIFPAVSVELAGRSIGVFPAAVVAPGTAPIQVQKLDAMIDAAKGVPSAAALTIEMQSGMNLLDLPQGFSMGRFSIVPSWRGGQWNVFAAADGTPFGVNDLIYHYQGETVFDSAPIPYEPFQCADMAPL